ncbi:2,3-diaminopropionate biosynthesis protein SbnA [Amycolatopsis rhizosphaerae]|uniref:2,3-diaminopropionate biosynthesis protein SbnA n=1 Tax=Amycolatopsis rhizosphaerae TaxID=2053003 RepID=A0A558DJI5_9PSEU|nr:2,3-diaminopropionate biosynthesis protein SbnA [Amycolatopsis rhizosphaerae]
MANPFALAEGLDRIGAGFVETPVVRLDHDRLNLFAKLEFGNPNGSVKDRSAYLILKRAAERGELTPESTVVESSSGNFAISLASFCRMLGVPFVPVIDPNVNPATERFLRTICERVEKVTERDASGGFLHNRLARTNALLTLLDDAYWPNQYANTDAADAHHRLTGGELCRVFDRIDYLFVGVGTGATITGLSRRMRESLPGTKVIAVDTVGSAIFGDRPRARHIPGIGSSIRPPLLDHAQIDDVVLVSETAAVAACHRLLRRHGIYAGGSSGSVYAAIEEYFAGCHGTRPTVVFLCADRGTAYADTVYQPGWLADRLSR